MRLIYFRLGGWIDTTRHADKIIYEHGPRTVRPAGPQGANTLVLVEELGLADKVHPIAYGHPTTQNRLILVDGKLHKLPASLGSVITKLDPKFPLISAGLNDLITPAKKCEDDSLYDFTHRRFGAEVAEYAIGR